MTQVYLQYQTVTTTATALSTEPLVLNNVRLTGKASNTGAVTLSIHARTTTLEQGEWETFERIDLRNVLVSGTAGDVIKIASGVV